VRALLLRRKAAQADIEAVIHRLREHGYVDDIRFARSFVAARVENDLHGRVRVRRDLAARRVRPEIAEEAVRAGFDTLDEAQLLREHLRRKIRITQPLDKPSKVQSLHRRLLRAGFRSDTIVGELKRLLRVSSRSGSDDEPVRWDELLDSLAETEEPESEPRA
jgi:regulatory protein